MHRHTTASRHWLRPSGTLLLVAALLFGTVLPAAAGPPERRSAREVLVTDCTVSAGGLVANLWVGWTDEPDRPFDSSVSVLDAEGQDVAYSAPGVSASFDGRVLTGTLDLHAASSDPPEESPLPDGDPAEVIGEVSFALELVEDGAPTQDGQRWRLHNRTVREVTTTTPLLVTDGVVTLTLHGTATVFEASGCTGLKRAIDLFASTPDTDVNRDEPSYAAVCDSTDGRLWFDIDSSERVPVAHVTLFPEQPTALSGAAGIDWGRALQGTLLLADDELERETAAAFDLTVTRTGRTQYTLVYSTGRDRMQTTFYRLDGTVTVEGHGSFEISGCEAIVQQSLNRRSDPAGPKAGGPAPANDAPEHAVALAPGGRGVNVQTRGTDVASEVPVVCAPPWDDDGEPLPWPVGHTLWYAVTGTGGPLTIDPAGSSFNTVVAAYVLDDDRLEQVGCADDILGDPHRATLQAPLTLDTVADQTYLVQIGGYAEQHGRLRVTVR